MRANKGVALRFQTQEELAARARRIVQLREMGLTFAVIGKRLGIDRSTACAVYNQAIAHQETQHA